MGQEGLGRPNYVIDAPGLVRLFGGVGAVAAGATACLFALGGGVGWLRWLAAATALLAAYGFGMVAVMVYGSRVDKVRRREALLDLVAWRGDETVLDVGCGRGMMVVGAARRVPHGGAVGVDVWRPQDQTGNGPEAVAENARREGVSDRVSVETADACRLPCPNGSFDVVVSHWVVHNLPTAGQREQAVAEMVRVVKPGGRVILADIAHHREYAEQLARQGMRGIRRIPPGWFGRFAAVASFGSFYPAAVVAAKPDAAVEQGAEAG